mgnify:CR=1 FL=1
MDTVRGLQIFKLLRFSFIILIRVLLAKTYLSLAEIGVYDTLLFISGTFTFFWISTKGPTKLSSPIEHPYILTGLMTFTFLPKSTSTIPLSRIFTIFTPLYWLPDKFYLSSLGILPWHYFGQ